MEPPGVACKNCGYLYYIGIEISREIQFQSSLELEIKKNLENLFPVQGPNLDDLNPPTPTVGEGKSS